ncbi:MAG: OB-fold domain-containing protein [Gammaproteobacteria bacterium]|nr:OB-fold domain-containing protein [Gammaproteobacteria bacterium]
MSRQPLEEGYFVIHEDGSPALLGSYSKAADKHYFPIRKQCPITEEPVETVELPTEGVLYSWTYIHMPVMGATEMGFGGTGVGQIDLPNGVRIQANLKGKEGDWEIGMKMKLDLQPVVKKGDVELCTFCFAIA